MENEDLKIQHPLSTKHNVIESGYDISQPENYTREYNDDVCRGCIHIDYELVSHTGGGCGGGCDGRVSVEQAWCVLGYWQDEF